MGFGRMIKGLAGRILALDSTQKPEHQFSAISDISLRHSFSLEGKKLEEAVKELQKKHLIDSVTVTNRNGSTLASSNGNSAREAITGTALFHYVQSELPESETVLVRGEKGWFMLLPFQEKIFIVRASSELSTIELKAMAKELDSFMQGMPV